MQRCRRFFANLNRNWNFKIKLSKLCYPVERFWEEVTDSSTYSSRFESCMLLKVPSWELKHNTFTSNINFTSLLLICPWNIGSFIKAIHSVRACYKWSYKWSLHFPKKNTLLCALCACSPMFSSRISKILWNFALEIFAFRHTENRLQMIETSVEYKMVMKFGVSFLCWTTVNEKMFSWSKFNLAFLIVSWFLEISLIIKHVLHRYMNDTLKLQLRRKSIKKFCFRDFNFKFNYFKNFILKKVYICLLSIPPKFEILLVSN